MIPAKAKSAYRIALFRLRADALRRVPLETSYSFARWHGRRYYARHRDAFRRRRAADMARRLGVTTSQAESWLERYYELASSDKLDRHLFWRMSVDEIDRLIEVKGLEHLDAALREGRGAILYSGHVWGHFTLFTTLALRGYPLSIVGFPGMPGLEARVIELVDNYRNAFLRERLGVQMLRMSEFGVAVKAQRALSANGVLAVEIDQPHTEDRLKLDFLGGAGYFPTGYAELAESCGAPLLHFWLHRADERWLPQVAEIGPPYRVTEGTVNAIHHCARLIERAIRRDPPTWLPWLYDHQFVWEPPRTMPGAPDLSHFYLTGLANRTASQSSSIGSPSSAER